ncbi:MAG: O-antigen ligase family protein [Proteobacteria bacterium]|nr:O-antigen ligase family protein [Pseudomonadota bacterium]
MVSASYIISLVLLCAITIASSSGVALGGLLLVFVPQGLRWFVLSSILMVFIFFIYVYSDRKHEIRFSLTKILILWVPFILYIAIRSELLPVGLWKFAGFIMKVFFPCMVVIILYVNDRDRFEKFFIPVLVVLNVLMAIAAPILPDEEEMFNLSIWLSRGIAVSIFFLVTEFRFNRKLLFKIPLIVFFLGIMVFIGSRGPLLSLLITLSLYVCFMFKNKMITIPLVVYCIFIIVVAFYYLEPAKKAFTSFLTHGHRNQMQVENFANDRIRLIKPTLLIVKENPVFGCGFGSWVIGYIHSLISDKSYSNFNYKRKFKRDFYYYPHNLICELLCELGIIGFMLYMLIFYPFKQFFSFRNRYVYLVVMAFLFAMTTDDLTGNPGIYIFNTLLLLTSGSANGD